MNMLLKYTNIFLKIRNKKLNRKFIILKTKIIMFIIKLTIFLNL